MAFLASFHSFSLTVSHVERGVYLQRRIKIPRFEDESGAHLFARVLAWCHAYSTGLEFVHQQDSELGADAISRSATGEISNWVAIGEVSEKNALKVANLGRESTKSLYFTSDEEELHFCRYLRGATENWAAKIKFFRISANLLDIEELASSSQLEATFVDESAFITINGTAKIGEISPVNIWAVFQKGIQGVL